MEEQGSEIDELLEEMGRVHIGGRARVGGVDEGGGQARQADLRAPPHSAPCTLQHFPIVYPMMYEYHIHHSNQMHQKK